MNTAVKISEKILSYVPRPILVVIVDAYLSFGIAKDSGMFTEKFKELLSAAVARLKLESRVRTVFQKHGMTGILTNPKYQEFTDFEEYVPKSTTADKFEIYGG